MAQAKETYSTAPIKGANIGPFAKITPNKQGTTKADPLSGMQRSQIPHADIVAAGKSAGGKKAPGRNVGAPVMPGGKKQVDPGKRTVTKHPL